MVVVLAFGVRCHDDDVSGGGRCHGGDSGRWRVVVPQAIVLRPGSAA